MKTFFATFAAILCAAAVIWGIHSHQLAEQASADRDREYLKTFCSVCHFNGDIVIADRVLEDTSKMVDRQWVESIIRLLQRGRLSREETRKPVDDFVLECHSFTWQIRRRFPAKKEWADGVDAKLAELEKLQATALP